MRTGSAEAALLGALPGEEKSLRLPREVIERLKTTVFGFDTFWVTRCAPMGWASAAQ